MSDKKYCLKNSEVTKVGHDLQMETGVKKPQNPYSYMESDGSKEGPKHPKIKGK